MKFSTRGKYMIANECAYFHLQIGFMFMIFSLTERVHVYDMVSAHQIIQGNG